jgi:hypothetical protein
MSDDDRAIWQAELGRVEDVAKVHLAALDRRLSALEASMSDDSKRSDTGPSASRPDSRPAKDDSLPEWLDQIGRGEDTRPDALIGEIVRFLVRADKTAFAKIYALAKTEAERMDARSNERFRALYRSFPKTKDSPPAQTDEKSRCP